MDITIPNLTSYQKDILFSKARFTITVASTKAGKTHSHIIWLYAKAHAEGVTNGNNFWWVAPVYMQAKIAYKRLKRNLLKSGRYKFNESSLIIYCPNGAEIHFKSADNADSLYGEDVYAAVFDEASRAKEESWYALRSTLTATNGECKLIGNFKGSSNWMSKLAEKSQEDENYEFFRVTCWDAVREGILDLAEVEEAQRNLPPKIFSELYEAAPSEDVGQLIDNESIKTLFSNTEVDRDEVYITADIARMGADATVIMVWYGLYVIDIISLPTSTIRETVQAIKKLQVKYNVEHHRVVVDEDGVGGGVKDYLNDSVIGFINNSRALEVNGERANFANLKSQCYYKLAEMINAKQVAVKCDLTIQGLLTEELEWVRLPAEVDTSKIAVLAKSKIKKEIVL